MHKAFHCTLYLVWLRMWQIQFEFEFNQTILTAPTLGFDVCPCAPSACEWSSSGDRLSSLLHPKTLVQSTPRGNNRGETAFFPLSSFSPLFSVFFFFFWHRSQDEKRNQSGFSHLLIQSQIWNQLIKLDIWVHAAKKEFLDLVLGLRKNKVFFFVIFLHVFSLFS